MFRYAPRVLTVHGWYGLLSSYGVALMASAGLFTLVALVWESRVPWPLTSLYASAYVNDLGVLCVVFSVLNVMCRSIPPGTYRERVWWPYAAAMIAIGVGCYFQFGVDAGYPTSVALSPTHLAHSFGSVVNFTYLLLRGAPGLLFGTKGLRAFAHCNLTGMLLCLVVVVGLLEFFTVAPVIDARILHSYPWGAHGPYAWKSLHLYHKLTPQNPGWMPANLLQNAAHH